ncbi:MAG: chemotaxis protein CheW [Deltaproteobacteria bacterium]|nr:chemotaxis protein CheW [Deltaproteobacteria bacterium]
MTQPPAAPPLMALLVRVDDRLCALPLGQVLETLRPLPVTAIEGQPAFVRGVATIRGAATPVLDLAILVLGVSTMPAGRFVTVKVGDRVVALAVGTVLGVRELPAGSTEALPPLLAEVSAELVTALGQLDAELFFVLRAAHLVPDSVWQALESGPAEP